MLFMNVKLNKWNMLCEKYDITLYLHNFMAFGHCYSHAELALTVPFLSYCNVLTGNTFVMFNPYCDILRTFSAGVCPLWGPVHTLVIPWLSAWDVIPSVRRWDGNGVRLVDTSLHMYIYYQYLHYWLPVLFERFERQF